MPQPRRSCTGLPTDLRRGGVQSVGVNILIVEDNRHMRRMLVEMVGSVFLSACILEAADAKSALDLCHACRPELVLMDVGLPDANGIALTATIKALIGEVRVVVVSSHRSRIYQDEARAAGATAYVLKDEVHDKLLPALTRAAADRCLIGSG